MRRSDLSRRAVCAAGLALPAIVRAGAATPLPIVELRRYRTQPGRRDELIDLFEREFVETQEAVGMKVIATFREPAEPDRFTWLRGFADMQAREKGLNGFYFGPVWQAHRDAANACIADSDDVLLLREAWPGSGFAPSAAPRAPAGEGPASRPGLVVATVCYPADPSGFTGFFRGALRPRMAAAGIDLVGAFAREQSPNNFPRLPVRESEEVFVWFTRFKDAAARDAATARLTAAAGWKEVEAELGRRFAKPPYELFLQPTRRSQLHA